MIKQKLPKSSSNYQNLIFITRCLVAMCNNQLRLVIYILQFFLRVPLTFLPIEVKPRSFLLYNFKSFAAAILNFNIENCSVNNSAQSLKALFSLSNSYGLLRYFQQDFFKLKFICCIMIHTP